MIFDLLSSLGPGETIVLIVFVSITVMTIARYIFKDSEDVGEQTTPDLTADELKQIVGQAVEEKMTPIRERVAELEKQRSRQLSADETQRSLSDANPPAPSDDRA